jgi:putative DNA primase/helicase
MRLAFYPHTDLGNAERFRERWKGNCCGVRRSGWLAWDGKRWSRDGAEDLVKIAEHKTVRAIQDEAELVRESGRHDVDDPSLARATSSSRSRRTTRSCCSPTRSPAGAVPRRR